MSGWMDELDGLDELKDVWVHISLEKSNYYCYCWPITHAIECEKKVLFFLSCSMLSSYKFFSMR